MITKAIDLLPLAALIVACAVASVTDVRTRKIPNYIPIFVFSCALIFQACHGWLPLLQSLGIAFAVLLAGWVLFALRWMGGGDIKLLAAGAALVGPPHAANFLWFSIMSGGVLSIIAIVLRRQILATIPSLIIRVQQAPRNPKVLLDAQNRSVLPYALAIAAGAVETAFSHYIPVALRIT